VEAMREYLTSGNRYPVSEYRTLAEKIASFHKVRPEQVVLGAGSREIIRIALTTYVTKGKRLLVASPTFQVTTQLATSAGISDVVAIPLKKQLTYDLDAMLARVGTSTGLVYICNPNNPTGTITPRRELEHFLKRVPAATTVLMDEAYHDYVGPTSDYSSFIENPVDDDRLIVIRTFSKIYGLAGLRVGYAISSKEKSAVLSSDLLPLGINSMGCKAAMAALDDTEYVQLCAKRNVDIRQEFYNQINARMLRSIDSLTNFVLMKTGFPADQAIEHFKKNNVLLGPPVPSMNLHVRVSMGTPNEMREFWRVWGLLPARGMSM
jgi:histidinol-phosphate aminotransferase